MNYYQQGLVQTPRRVVGAEEREPWTISIIVTLGLVGLLFFKAGKAVS